MKDPIFNYTQKQKTPKNPIFNNRRNHKHPTQSQSLTKHCNKNTPTHTHKKKNNLYLSPRNKQPKNPIFNHTQNQKKQKKINIENIR